MITESVCANRWAWEFPQRGPLASLDCLKDIMRTVKTRLKDRGWSQTLAHDKSIYLNYSPPVCTLWSQSDVDRRRNEEEDRWMPDSKKMQILSMTHVLHHCLLTNLPGWTKRVATKSALLLREGRSTAAEGDSQSAKRRGQFQFACANVLWVKIMSAGLPWSCS